VVTLAEARLSEPSREVTGLAFGVVAARGWGIKRVGGVEEGELAGSLSRRVMVLYMASISGVMIPRFKTRLFFARMVRLVRDIIFSTSISSLDMQAWGERSASGCGSVVFRSWLPNVRYRGGVEGQDIKSENKLRLDLSSRKNDAYLRRKVQETRCPCEESGLPKMT
jgi:hypothetical protein